MFNKLRKTIRYSVYTIFIIALVFAYVNYRDQINFVVPVEDFFSGLWPGFKDFVASFDVVPEYRPFVVQKQKPVVPVEVPQQKGEEFPEVSVEYTAHQKSGDQEFTFGYDKDMNLVSASNGTKTAQFYYSPESLLSQIVDGDRHIKLAYNGRSQVTYVNDSVNGVTHFKYSLNGWLNSVVLPDDDTLTFETDSAGNIVKAQRGVGTEMTMFYKNNVLSSFTKDGVTSSVMYSNTFGAGAQNLVKLVQTKSDFLVLNYGQDRLLSYLAGTKYGLGETISYNTKDITLVSAHDNSTFTGDPEPARINALNVYVGCTKFKKLPVLFDPIAYVLFSTYFKEDITGYLVNNYVCNVVYGRSLT